jgi:hypothetical protein
MNEALPPNWRPEWRAPKSRRCTAAAPVSASPDPTEPLPTPEAMRETALRTLLTIVANPAAGDTARVSAAKALLDLNEKHVSPTEGYADLASALEDS